MVINTLTQCADRVIIRLILCVILRMSKTSFYLSEKNNSMRRNFRQNSNFSERWKNGSVHGKEKNSLASHKEPPDLISWMYQNHCTLTYSQGAEDEKKILFVNGHDSKSLSLF